VTELLLSGAFVAALVVAVAKGHERMRPEASTLLGPRPADVIEISGSEINDLPCPWCMAPTRENDDHCPACGQRFG